MIERNHKANLRLWVLSAILGVCLAAGVVHRMRIWYYERQLVEIAHALVEEANPADSEPIPPEGPEADVEIQVMCRFEYLVLGAPLGRINLIIRPRAHAPETGLSGIEYVYVRQQGEWRLTDSYHM